MENYTVKKHLLATALLILSPSLAIADVGADGMYNLGKKGDKAKAKRTVNITMREASDGKRSKNTKLLWKRTRTWSTQMTIHYVLRQVRRVRLFGPLRRVVPLVSPVSFPAIMKWACTER